MVVIGFGCVVGTTRAQMLTLGPRMTVASSTMLWGISEVACDNRPCMKHSGGVYIGIAV